MSAVAQGFVAGIAVGSALYFITRSNVLAHYHVTSREVSRFNLALNPKHVVDEYKVQKIPMERNWVVSPSIDTQQSLGRRPDETWNRYVAQLYSVVATAVYKKKNDNV